MEELTIKVDGKEYKVKVEESSNGKIKVYHDNEVYEVETKGDIGKELFEESTEEISSEGKDIIKAPLPGIVVAVNVKAGDVVKEGDSLVKLVAMKMENDIIAEKNGIVRDVAVKKNDNVNKGDILVVIN
ncbi:biotin/lipoyl-binding protein [Candidatus Pacearchaeota archaeon]|nr:biotin/lipoyl-binding protein [Candidatus Pacearchaeota archaeon]